MGRQDARAGGAQANERIFPAAPSPLSADEMLFVAPDRDAIGFTPSQR